MYKRILLLLFVLSAFYSGFAQLDFSIELTDDRQEFNCYTSDITTGKDVLVTYMVNSGSSTCTGTCIYYWTDGEDDNTTSDSIYNNSNELVYADLDGDDIINGDDIIKKDNSNTSFNYTTDGQFTPSLVVFDDVNLPDSVKTSEFIAIEQGYVENNNVKLIVYYKTTNPALSDDPIKDTLTLSFNEIDTVEDVNKGDARLITVFSPVFNPIPTPRIAQSLNSIEDENDGNNGIYPYVNESFLFTFTTNPNFVTHDDSAWVYSWDFGHDNPGSFRFEEKEARYQETTNDSIDHLFPYENPEGYTVSLTVTLNYDYISDEIISSSRTIEYYNLGECYHTLSIPSVEVYDYFFGSDDANANQDKKTPYVPNVFTPNGDGDNEVFTFGVSGQDYFTLEVYNRWGNLVYEQSGYTIAWDGKTNNGGLCTTGVYYYIITSDAANDKHTTKGFVHLFR